MQKTEQMLDDMTLEELFEQLDQIVDQMENDQVSLEDSFRLYQKGMDMLKQCNEKIDTVEKKILVLEENGEVHEF